MRYLYHQEAGSSELTLTGDEHRYIFKVRRHKVEESLYLRNLKDGLLYYYRIEYLDKQRAILRLQESREHEVVARKPLHIGWCVIDPKNIEKILPTLNEMGVEKITFFYCKRSQKSFKIDFKRLEKILLNSSQQSGRSKMMTLHMEKDLSAFVEDNPHAKMLNFSPNTLNHSTNIETIVVGCEGGFDEAEVKLFEAENIVGFDSPLVLKSESAVCAVASNILL